MSGFEIRDMTEADGRAVLAIYQEGMDTGQATFQQTAPAWTDFDQGHLAAPRLVAVDAGDGCESQHWNVAKPGEFGDILTGLILEQASERKTLATA